jgi:hypothetical protein
MKLPIVDAHFALHTSLSAETRRDLRSIRVMQTRSWPVGLGLLVEIDLETLATALRLILR